MDITYEVFLNITIWLQALGDWLFPIMKGITFLGNEEFYLLIMPILYWCVSQPLGYNVGLILLFSSGINFLLKLTFHSPRPFWVSPEIRYEGSVSSYGFPSGHAQNAANIWGYIAFMSKRLWLKWVSISLIILIGISRLFLGVHFLHDVVGGWMIGAFLLLLFLTLQKSLSSWFATLSFRKQLLMTFAVSLLLIVLALLLSSPLMTYQIPVEWVQNAGKSFHPLNLEGIFTIGGVYFGLLSGKLLLEEEGGFSARGSLGKRSLRYPIGLAGVLLLHTGLGAVFPEETSSLTFTLRYFRYLLVGLWISYGAPRVFIAARLASHKGSLNESSSGTG